MEGSSSPILSENHHQVPSTSQSKCLQFDSYQESKSIETNRMLDKRKILVAREAAAKSNQEILANPGTEFSIGSNLNIVQWLPFNQISSLDSPEYDPCRLCYALPSDVKQGKWSTCWLDAAVAAVAKREDLLERIILTKKVNEEGIYDIRLHKDGCWHTVIIDDKLPCDEKCKLLFSNVAMYLVGPQSIFGFLRCQTKHPSIALIYKAAALLHNGYEALVENGGGFAREALTMLTGSPCESLQVYGEGRNADLIWEKLTNANAAGHVMVANCGGRWDGVPENVYESLNLRQLHTYSLLDMVLASKADGAQVRLIKLRNPTGFPSWSGPWSVESQLWEENLDLKKSLCQNLESGAFWIDLESVMKHFSQIDICKVYADSCHEVRMDGVFADSSAKPLAAYRLVLSKDCDMDFHLCHEVEKRRSIIALEQSDAQTCDGYICVFEFGGQNADGTMRLGPLVACRVRQVKTPLRCIKRLQSGAYLVLCFAFQHWPSATMIGNGAHPALSLCNYVLEVHSEEPFSLFRCHLTHRGLTDAVIQMTMREGVIKNHGHHWTSYTMKKSDTAMIAVAENRHPSKDCIAWLNDFEARDVLSTRGNYAPTDVIPPGHRQVLLVLVAVRDRSSDFPNDLMVEMQNPNDKRGYLSPGDANHPRFHPDVEALHEPRPI